MGVTEKEAKTKWCPMARIASGTVSVQGSNFDTNQPAINVVLDREGGARNYLGRCAGSACMMWHWSKRPERTDASHLSDEQRDAVVRIAKQHNPAANVRIEGTSIVADGLGRCGLSR